MSDIDHVVQRFDSAGGVTVEVIDTFHQKVSDTPEAPEVEERIYATVELLSNGWVRCHDTDEEIVSYFPPNFVNGIYTIPDSEMYR